MWFMYTAKIIKIWVDFLMCSSISILRFCLDLKILLTLPVLGIGLCSAFRQMRSKVLEVLHHMNFHICNYKLFSQEKYTGVL